MSMHIRKHILLYNYLHNNYSFRLQQDDMRNEEFNGIQIRMEMKI